MGKRKIKSPCSGYCKYNKAKLCLGCGRTKTEVKTWKKMDDEQKRHVLERSKAREEELGGFKTKKKKKK